MANRYEGNTGRVRHWEDAPSELPSRPLHRQPLPPSPPPGASPLPRQLQRLLAGSLGDLDTEDLLLLLILYLLYRESGDRDWLVTLGAMLFL